MQWLTSFERWRNRCDRLYTRIVRSGVGACGQGALFCFASRLIGPRRMFFGSNVIICEGCYLVCVEEWYGKKYAGRLEMGDRSGLARRVQISSAELVRIGKGVTVGPQVLICDHFHDHKDFSAPPLEAALTTPIPVIIEDESFIGYNSFIGPGITVGRRSVVAANSVVVKDVPPYTVVAGNPARPVRRYDEEQQSWIPVK